MVAGPPPAGAVAFATNLGDDPDILAVAEVVDGRLRVHATVDGCALAEQIPGERINGIALDGAGTLYVLDSDDTLTGLTWRDPGRVSSEVHLHAALFGEDRDEFQCVGEVCVAGDRLAVPFQSESGRVVLAFVDPESGRCTGRLDLPAPWHTGIVENGLLWLSGGDQTRLARWTTRS